MEEDTIQKIYERAFKEEHDNILIRDIQLQIENKINEMAKEYLEKIGFIYDYESEVYNGKITASDWDIENNKIIENVEFKIDLRMKSTDVRIESDNPEFDWN